LEAIFHHFSLAQTLPMTSDIIVGNIRPLYW
jgi:hypothetical protein